MLNIENLLTSLCEKDFYYQEQVFNTEFIANLNKELEKKPLNVAKIGKEKQISSDRTDHIYWLECDLETGFSKEYLKFTSELLKILNKELFLSLTEFECHFALYNTGGYYKPHLDNFKGNNNRLITFILYLNENWQEKDGGQLCIHHQGELKKFNPTAGSLICFKSADILHEVLPSFASRKSITGWFIKN